MDPGDASAWSHPHLDRILCTSRKVLAPLYEVRPSVAVLDRDTGELRETRAEPDGILRFRRHGRNSLGQEVRTRRSAQRRCAQADDP
ncbi:MAG: hypothetical protein WDA27_07830 [Actinomycetota bacterium]